MATQDFSKSVELIRQQLLKEDAMKRVGTMLAAGAGLGIGARSLVGVGNILNRNLSRPKNDGALQPYLVPVEGRKKQANMLSDFASGNSARSVYGIPWFIPAAALAGTGGAVAGYKTMDYLLDKNRKGILKSELQKAKQDYEAALSGTTKTAAEGTLAHDLDKLASMAESGINDVLGSAAGLYLLGALGVGGYVGAQAYNSAAKNSRRRLLEKARKQVARENLGAPLHAEIVDETGVAQR